MRLHTQTAQLAYAAMPDHAQRDCDAAYARRARSPTAWLLVGICLSPIWLMLADRRWGAALLFAATLGGFGVWWLYELALTLRRVRAHNVELESVVLREVRALL